MIHIHMDRAVGVANWHRFVGHGTDPWRQVCQALRDAGCDDDTALVIDERGVPCLTVKSVHAAARDQDRRDAALAKLKQRKVAA